MGELKTYSGGCHCGAVRYEVKADIEEPVVVCNCSMCGRSGTMLTFVPDEQFTLRSGEDSLADYQFNKKRIHHFFCKTCGIKSFARGERHDGKRLVAINVRCLDDVDIDKLTVKKFDGKHL